jgi:hypothetical protein
MDMIVKPAHLDVFSWPTTRHGGGVSATTQRKVGTTLTVALDKAVDLDLLPSNPAMKVDKPKAKKPDIPPFDLLRRE